MGARPDSACNYLMFAAQIFVTEDALALTTRPKNAML